MKSQASVLVCLLLAATGAMAQGVGTSGDISGTVVDSFGAVLPKVTVTITDTKTSLKREAVTDGAGQYHVARLSPSTYELRAEVGGFATEVRKGLTVNIGQTVISDFRMKPAQVGTVIEVQSEPPVVETERGSQADRINQQYITALPIDRRDYLAFTLLAPGVSDSTRLAGDQDFRVKQTPQSGLSFYGSNGRGNSITVDGGETSGDSGGVRLTVSQDAVQEFQINRSNYGADLGSATGASINIVTKSGGNGVHGSLYGFFRNDAMDARNPFSFSQALAPGQTFNPLKPDAVGSPIKDTLSRQQYGGAIGFPLKKDQTFLFASFEGLRQDAQNAVPLLTNTNVFRPTADQSAIIAGVAGRGTVPCLSGPVGAAVAQQLGLPAPNPTTNLPGPVCAAVLTGVLTLNPATSPLNAFLVNQFETQGGVFPYTNTWLRVVWTTASVRITRCFSPTGMVMMSKSHPTCSRSRHFLREVRCTIMTTTFRAAGITSLARTSKTNSASSGTTTASTCFPTSPDRPVFRSRASSTIWEPTFSCPVSRSCGVTNSPTTSRSSTAITPCSSVVLSCSAAITPSRTRFSRAGLYSAHFRASC